VPTPKVEYETIDPGSGAAPPARGTMTVRHLYGENAVAIEYDRAALRRGDTVTGPAVVREPMSTTFVPAGRTLTTGGHGEIIIE